VISDGQLLVVWRSLFRTCGWHDGVVDSREKISVIADDSRQMDVQGAASCSSLLEPFPRFFAGGHRLFNSPTIAARAMRGSLPRASADSCWARRGGRRHRGRAGKTIPLLLPPNVKNRVANRDRRLEAILRGLNMPRGKF